MMRRLRTCGQLLALAIGLFGAVLDGASSSGFAPFSLETSREATRLSSLDVETLQRHCVLPGATHCDAGLAIEASTAIEHARKLSLGREAQAHAELRYDRALGCLIWRVTDLRTGERLDLDAFTGVLLALPVP